MKDAPLNSTQQKAAETTEGRVLILAGAGSGKTKVIVHRIAHLIQNKKVPPESILGLTFTNKAALEMRERATHLLSKESAKKIVLTTFHSFCMRLLREEIHHLGYTKEFSLYDESDVKRLLKQIARDVLSQEGELPSIEPIAAKIGAAKSRGLYPKDIHADMPLWKDSLSRTLYERLYVTMRSFNAVDFDSLLILTIELFEKYPAVLKHYQNRYRYIMIDEYQDTNPVQYKIATLLSKEHQNLCVVGDDDQSIYGWRGAELKNILHFDAALVIKLEQNYRSLPTILKAANALISHNKERHHKELFSHFSTESLITLFHAPSEEEEAASVVQRLLHLKKAHSLNWRDFAILYRSNTLARPFEMALLQGVWEKEKKWVRGIPYQIFGGTELYARSEIKDLMAYLRLIANPQDEEALLRIVNVPRRGISEKTLEVLTTANRKQGISLWQLMNALPSSLGLTEKAIKALESFTALIEKAKQRFQETSLKEALRELVEKIDYKEAIAQEVKSDPMRAFKWANVESCMETLGHYEEETQTPSLHDFLTSTLLDATPFNQKGKTLFEDRVNVMTFHSAKGLEFEACFLVALEDHIIPHEKSILEHRLEEERRLMYVAITRAKKHLTLSMSRKRKRYGTEEDSAPSRFLTEIPKDLLRIVSWKTPI